MSEVSDAIDRLVIVVSGTSMKPLTHGEQDLLNAISDVATIAIDALVRIANAQEIIAAQAKGPDPLATGTGVTGSP